MQEKLSTLVEAIAPVEHGSVVALQNMATQAAPMALVRELIRQEKRNLGLVVLVGGMAVDWLAAADVIDRLVEAYDQGEQRTVQELAAERDALLVALLDSLAKARRARGSG